MDSYALVLSEEAAMTLAAASRWEQRKLSAVLEGIKQAPFRPGELQERDARGRINEVVIADNWLVTYWSDHGAREVRIVALERVGD